MLVTTTGSAGHLGPLLPFVAAIRDAGDDVLIATRSSSAERVRATGHPVWAFADGPAGRREAVFATMRDLTPAEANRRALDVFVGIDADAALPGMREACAHWQPDLVLSEPSEFAGGLVAGQLDLPVVTVAITQLAVEHELRDATRAALDRLRTAHGLRASNGAGSARFTLMPEVLEDPAHPGPPGVHRFREPDAAAPAPLPDWWERDADPLVYVTFGSVAAGMGFFPDLFRAAIDALAALPVRLLVTVGRDHDPLELGDVAPNVHVERWIPQAAILPHAAAVVCHGGSGTVRGGLAAGLPLVVLPLFADQSHNAARVQALGAGIALDHGVGALAGAVRRVLDDAGYARRAGEVADAIRTLPTVDAAVGILRRLTR